MDQQSLLISYLDFINVLEYEGKKLIRTVPVHISRWWKLNTMCMSMSYLSIKGTVIGDRESSLAAILYVV